MDKNSIWRHAIRLAGVAALSAWLAGCSSVGVGVGIPVGPLSVGVGVSRSGPSIGVGTGLGPVGVGVGVQSSGRVTGHARVGVSAPVGPASVGVGVGHSTVLHEPSTQTTPSVSTQPRPEAARQWQDSQGRAVPECQTRGGC